MEIIPLEDQLLIEAYINPRDVAYVRTGMPALVKRRLMTMPFMVVLTEW